MSLFLAYARAIKGKSYISGFRCDICELVKSHRALFPLILNKSPFPFMVIHSDVWAHPKSQL